MDSQTISQGLTKVLEKLEIWGVGIIKMIPNFILAVLVVLIFWALSRWTYNVMKRLFHRTDFNENLEHLLANICRILVFTLGLILALAVLELQKTVFSLLAGVGVVGLALGFAFQDLAANFISGIMIAIRSPLKIGDVVKIDGIMGTVIDIRLRDTLIRNFSGQDIFIPNKDFTTQKFSNYSSYGMRKVRIEVGIGYSDDPDKALKIVTQALSRVEGALTDPAPEAYISDLGGSSVNLFGHVWFTYPGGNFFQIQSDSIRNVKLSLEEAGFHIPFPIRTIDLTDGTKEVLERLKGGPSK